MLPLPIPSTSADSDYNGLSRDIMVSTQDDESPGITYNPSRGSITLTEGGSSNTYSYTVVLNTQPSADVMITISLPADSPGNLQLNSGSQTVMGADTSIDLSLCFGYLEYPPNGEIDPDG